MAPYMEERMVEDQSVLEREDQQAIAPAAAILATAIAAGLVAFMVQRARRPQEQPIRGPRDMWERVQDREFRERTAEATREFVADRVLPELKPALLRLLRDVKAYVDIGFKRAEKVIRDL